MSTMTIIEAADYILGRKFLGALDKEPYRADKKFLEDAKVLMQKHPTAYKNLSILDSSKLFFAREVDLAHEVPANQREEFFYGMKVGFISSVIPAKALFYMQKCQEEYSTLNVLPKFVLSGDLTKMFSEGYCADGYNIRDVICSIFQQDYMPLEDCRLVTKNNDYWDVYIQETDMVATVPTRIKEKLQPEDIRRLHVDGTTIKLSENPIYMLGGYIGAVNSTYDLRNII
jgi:hypothetical protein